MKHITFDEMNEGIREEIYTDVIQEFDYIIDLQLSDDQKQAKDYDGGLRKELMEEIEKMKKVL